MTEIVVQTKNLTKRYNNLTAVDGLTLEVFQGEIFGLLGPNGAGKTTSIHMMCGLLAPDGGEVFIQGKLVHGGDVEVRARVGVCPQQTIFWEKLTCSEQLEFIGTAYNVPRKVARQRGDELLDILGLGEKRDQLAATLSGGMQRRLNLALGLIHDPEILVLDEPEAGLDPQSRVLVREYIHSLARKKTIILTTHNMDEADRMADRVAIIDHGKLLVLDTPEALKQTVGDGDVLELMVAGILREAGRLVLERFGAVISPQIALRDSKNMGGTTSVRRKTDLPPISEGVGERPELSKYLLRAPGIGAQIPAILAAVQTAGGQVSEVHLRANTLEDVFIALTGRRLRQ